MKISPLHVCICLAASTLGAASASAQVLFSDNFNVNSSASWTTNAGPAASIPKQSATFAFDYSALGIPAAPGSGDTLGLRLRANIPGTPEAPVTTRPTGTISGLSLSPTGKSFGTSYKLEFYAWANYFGYNGNLGDNVNSQGGTNNVYFGVGTAGTTPAVLGQPGAIATGIPDGVTFATTGDGGIADDYRAYLPGVAAPIAGTTAGVYAAGAAADALKSESTFYTNLFPSVSAPAVQQTIAANEYTEPTTPVPIANPMLGISAAGSIGFAWQKITVTKNGNAVTWAINDNLIATVDAASVTLGGQNILIGASDVNTGTARYPSLVFTLFDNLTVTSLAPPGLAGDFNSDNKVDGADFLVWQRGGSPTPTSPADLATWKANFGQTAPPVAAVPEPGTIGLSLLGVAALGLAARRRS
ncbi:PEP-CTERM sorting domain-containing protein [Lacipirellula sp.]|uniref:PEP-CTERM sorting domain-containing protein n=1 Tax=Lacipirellula sp. TaxID=2691419 RepID=UPI003D128E6D